MLKGSRKSPCEISGRDQYHLERNSSHFSVLLSSVISNTAWIYHTTQTTQTLCGCGGRMARNTLGLIKHTVLKTMTEQLQNGKKRSLYPQKRITYKPADLLMCIWRVAVAAFHVGACGFQIWEHSPTGEAVSGHFCHLTSRRFVQRSVTVSHKPQSSIF